MLQQIKKFFDEKGQGIVEYALILAFVVAIAVAISNGDGLKSAVEGAFDKAENQINTNVNTNTSGSGTGTGTSTNP